MAKTVSIRAQIDSDLKESVDDILKKMGLTTSQAISSFYHAIKHYRGFPDEFKIPNRKTRRAMRDVELGRNLKEYKDTDAMFRDLGIR